MKWKDLKKLLEDKGVKDDDEIAYIDLYHFGNSIDIEKADGGWVIQD
jgi:hypothetical protein